MVMEGEGRITLPIAIESQKYASWPTVHIPARNNLLDCNAIVVLNM